MIFKEFFDTVIVSSDGEDGLNKFKKNRVDIVITDINMPKLNGIDMIKKIREISQNVSIVVISAYNNTSYLTDSIKYQVQDYLFKPINREAFKETLTKIKNQLIEKKNQQNQTRLLEDYKKVIDNSTIVSKTDTKGIITYVNDEFCKVSGYSSDELIGKNHNIIRDPNEPSTVFQEMWRRIKNRETWQGIIKNRSKNGDIYYVKTTIRPIINDWGEIEEFIASRTLITDIINPKQQLYDFIKPMDEAIVILIKIEDFKYIDGYNQKELKENLQREFAHKLFDVIPKECDFFKIYLLDNGEFAIAKNHDSSKNNCCNNQCPNIEILIEQMKDFQNKINRAKINTGYIDYDLSIMVSLAYGKNALEDAKLGLKHLLEEKQTFIVANGFSKKNQDKSISRIETFRMIKSAIDSYNIVSHFQPIVNNKTKKIEKYESLVRLIDNDKNILPPYLFLNTSKKGKYYIEITYIVLENSFKALNKTHASISINLSASNIEIEDIRAKFISLLKENRDSAKRIILELTEEEKINDFKIIKQFIDEIKALGVKIAIDDFGVGYSCFERILDYNPDILKIDGRLIKDINKNHLSYSIVESIVSFAQKEKLQTIAEFVESEDIYNTLCKLGVDYSQGYYFGKPDIL
jgi:PAS domain S-box-containing protein